MINNPGALRLAALQAHPHQPDVDYIVANTGDVDPQHPLSQHFARAILEEAQGNHRSYLAILQRHCPAIRTFVNIQGVIPMPTQQAVPLLQQWANVPAAQQPVPAAPVAQAAPAPAVVIPAVAPVAPAQAAPPIVTVNQGQQPLPPMPANQNVPAQQPPVPPVPGINVNANAAAGGNMSNVWAWIAGVLLTTLAIIFIVIPSLILGQLVVANPLDVHRPIQLETVAGTTAGGGLTIVNNGGAGGSSTVNNPGDSSGSGTNAAPVVTDQSVVAAPAGFTNCAGLNKVIAQFPANANPYDMIDRLNATPGKENHAQPDFALKTDADEGALLWTGLYDAPNNDLTLGGNIVPFNVDGQTGVYIVKSGVNIASVPNPGALLRVTCSNMDVILGRVSSPDTSVSTECADPQIAIVIINNLKTKNPKGIFGQLDAYVDQHPTVRVISSKNSTDLTGLKPLQTLIWVQPGAVKVSDPKHELLEITRDDGKSLYLVNSTMATVTHQFSGMSLCSGINPEHDFPWWGKL